MPVPALPSRCAPTQDGTEIAVAGGVCDKAYPPFRVLPAEVDMVDVGSIETRSHRRIFHILGKNAAGRAGNLLVSELYCDHGCWSGYPPHKHDADQGDAETNHEETYHYRFRPESGFGAQLCFQPDGSSQCFMTRHGDTFLLDRGYHPTVTSPGHEEYIFTILVGKSQRGLVQNFKEDYHYLMARDPGHPGHGQQVQVRVEKRTFGGSGVRRFGSTGGRGYERVRRNRGARGAATWEANSSI